jgi:hypothetical protein
MRWTIEELAGRVGEALASAAYPGAPNGRVRDVPDARAIRWYATIGLVDRPSAMRGRTALYGPRHLLQIVAVKRRQAQGHRLADIQAELAGATDETLRRIAELPELAPDEPEPPPEPARPRFWTDRPPPDHEIRPPDGERRRAPGGLRGVHLNGLHLGGGAVLLLPTAPGPDDVPAILAAARPLLDVLEDRALLADNPKEL